MVKAIRTLSHPLTIYMALLFYAVAYVWTPTLADTIQLKNGYRTSGRLVSLTRNLCIFETGRQQLEIDVMTIAWLATSEPVTLILESGDRVTGTITNLRLGTLFIHSNESGHFSLSSGEVAEVSRKTGSASPAAIDNDKTLLPNASAAGEAPAQLALGDQHSGTPLSEHFGQILPLVQAANTEQKKWDEAISINTATSYRSYLEMYPQGTYAPRAQLNLAILYEYEDDYAEAARWYRKAAEQGLAEAQSNLGELYAAGRGVDQDETEAARWYRKAAEQGLAEAQNNLGELYAAGRGVDQDETEAVRWYFKAAEQNNPWSQYNLGRMYEIGRSFPQDQAEAVRWYRKAAEQGNAFAQNNLGVMYEEGRGLVQDDIEAVSWYRKAAKQGFTPAQKSLERMCMRGVQEACS